MVCYCREITLTFYQKTHSLHTTGAARVLKVNIIKARCFVGVFVDIIIVVAEEPDVLTNLTFLLTLRFLVGKASVLASFG